MTYRAGNSDTPIRDRTQRRLLIGIFVSIAIHAFILSLQFGIPGIGLPSLDLPAQQKQAPQIDLQVQITNTPSKAPPLPIPKQLEPLLALAPALPQANGITLVAPPKPLPPPVQVPLKTAKKVASAKPSSAKQAALVAPPISAKASPVKVITQDSKVDESFVVPVAESKEVDAKGVVKTEENKVEPDVIDPTASKLKEAEEQRLLAEKEAKDREQVEKELRQKEEAKIAQEQEVKKKKLEAEIAAAEAERQKQAAFVAQKQKELQIKEQQQREQMLKEQQARELQMKEQLRQQQLADEERKRIEDLQRQQMLQQQKQAEEQDRLKKARAIELAKLEEERLEKIRKEEAQKELQKKELQRAEEIRQEELRKEELKKEEQRKEIARREEQRKEEIRKEEIRKEELARQRIAAEQAARQQQEEITKQQALARQRQQEELAAKQRADELAKQRAAADEAAAKQKAEALAAQQKGATQDGQTRGAESGNNKGSGGSSALVLPKNIVSGDLANRALEQTQGIDILRGNPPRPRPRGEDENKSRRKTVLGNLERDVSLRMYAESWRQKVERNGNFNYSQSSAGRARGELVLTVVIRSDGTVEDIVVNRTSGRTDLDEAARRIAKINARYAPFPPAIAAQYDVLEIRRVWSFEETLRIYEEFQ